MSQPDDDLQDDLVRNDPELAEFSDLVTNLRSAQPVEPEEPSPTVWAGIEAAIVGNEPSLVTAPISDLETARAARKEAAERRSRWGSRGAIFTAAAAAILLVAVPIGLALRGDGSEPVELAAANLDVLTSAASSPGEAALIERDDDGLWLEVNAEADTSGSDFLELWLLRPDDEGGFAEIISLGKLDGSEGYDVPDDLDLDATWIVDVSVEIDDGDDMHGGNSVLQGKLT